MKMFLVRILSPDQRPSPGLPQQCSSVGFRFPVLFLLFFLGFKLLSSLWLFPVARVICRRSVLRFPRAEFFPQASVRRSDFSHSGSFSQFCLVHQGLVQCGPFSVPRPSSTLLLDFWILLRSSAAWRPVLDSRVRIFDHLRSSSISTLTA
jgi:hypothetical protein